ncbi:metallophosphoesterase [Bifidobacterium samirii]|uniref:Serine/threonine protein phosphatase n=1 Tax=Bifidobacterium samirii TaxID=2306974 RepID=A0A430FHC8_9BIFI|nr:metallophosphoesterase [Bifidobacterium samirii]RSX52256.1 serine/threonine protein phosphatase [Bifidobacterium samirii]
MTERNRNDHHTDAAAHDDARPLSVSARMGRLQFHHSGKFRILQFADIQDGPKVAKDTIRLIEAACDAARPDLVVFTGNQIAGYDPAFAATFRKRRWTPAKLGDLSATRASVRAMVESFTAPLVARGIPFAVTYGNHDFQCGLSNDDLDAIYRTIPGCLNPAPPADGDGAAASDADDDRPSTAVIASDDAPGTSSAMPSGPSADVPSGSDDASAGIPGPVVPTPVAVPGSGLPDQRVYPCTAGTFALPVMDVDHAGNVLTIAVADSGDYSEEGGYGKPTARTMAFLRRVQTLTGARFLTFQHMPVPQFYDLLKPVEPTAPGAIQGYRAYESQYYALDQERTEPGSYLGEGVSCPDFDGGEFAALRDAGCFGIVAGHDHRNGFVGTVDGMMLVATPTCGFGSYGPAAENRAARLFEFDIRHPHEPRTQLLDYGELVGKPSSRKAYAYDIAAVKSDTEGRNLLHRKTVWQRIVAFFTSIFSH